MCISNGRCMQNAYLSKCARIHFFRHCTFIETRFVMLCELKFHAMKHILIFGKIILQLTSTSLTIGILPTNHHVWNSVAMIPNAIYSFSEAVMLPKDNVYSSIMNFFFDTIGRSQSHGYIKRIRLPE